MTPPRIAVIGAGPAGLTAAYLASKRGWRVLVLEADPVYVGGLSRTAEYKGFRFDIGGHRFFSKSQEVEDCGPRSCPTTCSMRPRSSRIYYSGRSSPTRCKAVRGAVKLGLFESCAVRALLLHGAAVPDARTRESFEDWVSNQFGERLFKIFFKTYTEKVWGMSCRRDLGRLGGAAHQGPVAGSAMLNALLPARRGARGQTAR